MPREMGKGCPGCGLLRVCALCSTIRQPRGARRAGRAVPPARPRPAHPAPLQGRARGSGLPAQGQPGAAVPGTPRGDKPPGAKLGAGQVPSRPLPGRADLTCQRAEDEEEAVATHGGAVGAGAGAPLGRCADVSWAWRPLGRDSCPLPPAAAPGSHGARGGTRDHPLPPLARRCSLLGSSSGILCRRGWDWGKGQSELCALSSPCLP